MKKVLRSKYSDIINIIHEDIISDNKKHLDNLVARHWQKYFWNNSKYRNFKTKNSNWEVHIISKYNYLDYLLPNLKIIENIKKNILYVYFRLYKSFFIKKNTHFFNVSFKSNFKMQTKDYKDTYYVHIYEEALKN